VAAKRVDFTYKVLDQFTKISRYADTSASTHVVSSHYSYDNLNRLTGRKKGRKKVSGTLKT
jgi:hypothetical protein